MRKRASKTADAPDGTGIQNPLIGDRAWFHRYDPSSPPIYIGEAACSAFATRFRRFLSGNSAMPHIPRTQYEREETIAAANEADIQWPSLHHARLLVRIAIHQIGHLYHLMMRKSTLDKLEEIYQTQDFDCTANKCTFFALFAFGQAYSIRSEPNSGSRVPGTSYFARSMSLVQILPERTSVTHLETLLLLVCGSAVLLFDIRLTISQVSFFILSQPAPFGVHSHWKRYADGFDDRLEPQYPRITANRPSGAPTPHPNMVDNLHLRPDVGIQNGSPDANPR